MNTRFFSFLGIIFSVLLLSLPFLPVSARSLPLPPPSSIPIEITISIIPNGYNLLFNPFEQPIALSALKYDDTAYKWETATQSWKDARAFESGQGVALIPLATEQSITLRGTSILQSVAVKRGLSLIGVPSAEALSLSDVVIAETNTPLDASGVDGYYAVIYKYDAQTGYKDVKAADRLQPGIGYFIDADKDFTLKLRAGAAPAATEITCASDGDINKYKCGYLEGTVVKDRTEEQYLVPEKLDILHEHDILQCQKVGDGYKFVLAPKDSVKHISENGKCMIGYACRSGNGQSWCQVSSPPPFRESGSGTIIGERPSAQQP